MLCYLGKRRRPCCVHYNTVRSDLEHYKLVLVGDDSVGKTSLISTVLSSVFPVDVPSVVDNIVVTGFIGAKPTTINVWDTPGNDKYDHLRPMAYHNADIIVCCYSVVNPTSFENVKNKWMPEIIHFCCSAPCILLGTQIDLRGSIPTKNMLFQKHGRSPITTEEGVELARSQRFRRYIECSALRHENIDDLFVTCLSSSFY
ncbi:cdc42 protein [Pelomyxa schiedti]|nr:cdc42 protein [Pelomyxa schiedti]